MSQQTLQILHHLKVLISKDFICSVSFMIDSWLSQILKEEQS
jgi:hypothetical protein